MKLRNKLLLLACATPVLLTVIASNKNPSVDQDDSEEAFLASANIQTTDDKTEIPAPVVIKLDENAIKLNLQRELINSVIAKDINALKDTLGKGVHIDSAPDQGTTALHIAANIGHYPIAKHLVEHGANVNVKNDDGYTPLRLAHSGQHKEVIKLLEEAGATLE